MLKRSTALEVFQIANRHTIGLGSG